MMDNKRVSLVYGDTFFDCLICICMVVKMMKNDWKGSEKVYNVRYIERFTESIKEIQLWLDI